MIELILKVGNDNFEGVVFIPMAIKSENNRKKKFSLIQLMFFHSSYTLLPCMLYKAFYFKYPCLLVICYHVIALYRLTFHPKEKQTNRKKKHIYKHKTE